MPGRIEHGTPPPREAFAEKARHLANPLGVDDGKPKRRSGAGGGARRSAANRESTQRAETLDERKQRLRSKILGNPKPLRLGVILLEEEGSTPEEKLVNERINSLYENGVALDSYVREPSTLTEGVLKGEVTLKDPDLTDEGQKLSIFTIPDQEEVEPLEKKILLVWSSNPATPGQDRELRSSVVFVVTERYLQEKFEASAKEAMAKEALAKREAEQAAAQAPTPPTIKQDLIQNPFSSYCDLVKEMHYELPIAIVRFDGQTQEPKEAEHLQRLGTFRIDPDDPTQEEQEIQAKISSLGRDGSKHYELTRMVDRGFFILDDPDLGQTGQRLETYEIPNQQQPDRSKEKILLVWSGSPTQPQDDRIERSAVAFVVERGYLQDRFNAAANTAITERFPDIGRKIPAQVIEDAGLPLGSTYYTLRQQVAAFDASPILEPSKSSDQFTLDFPIVIGGSAYEHYQPPADPVPVWSDTLERFMLVDEPVSVLSQHWKGDDSIRISCSPERSIINMAIAKALHNERLRWSNDESVSSRLAVAGAIEQLSTDKQTQPSVDTLAAAYTTMQSEGREAPTSLAVAQYDKENSILRVGMRGDFVFIIFRNDGSIQYISKDDKPENAPRSITYNTKDDMLGGHFQPYTSDVYEDFKLEDGDVVLMSTFSLKPSLDERINQYLHQQRRRDNPRLDKALIDYVFFNSDQSQGKDIPIIALHHKQ